MDYFDGNTVTALWNYAQRFAMSDNSYGTTFGPSASGVINLVSGQTHGGMAIDPGGNPVSDPGVTAPDAQGIGTVVGDPEPVLDDCSDPTVNRAIMTGRNIGDLLNAKQVTWGWFQGGFKPTATTAAGTAVCGSSHTNIGGIKVADYAPASRASSSTAPPPTRTTCRPPRWPQSATTTRPTISTT